MFEEQRVPYSVKGSGFFMLLLISLSHDRGSPLFNIDDLINSFIH